MADSPRPRLPRALAKSLLFPLLRLFRHEPKPSRTPPKEPLFGHDGSEVEAIAFSGGGFDALMDLGVIHALVMREHLHPGQCQLPHAFSGVSSGAVMAAIAADVLGHRGPTPAETTAVRAARLRQMLQLLLESPGQLLASLWPDLYEVKSGRPLKSLNLAIHNSRERRDRDEAVGARAGFITLINGVLGTSVPLSAVTRLIRMYLGAKAAGEEFSRWRHEVRWNRWRPRRLAAITREVRRLVIDSISVALRYGFSLSEALLRLYLIHLSGGIRVIAGAVVRELGGNTVIRGTLRRCMTWMNRDSTDAATVLSIARLGFSQAWGWFIRIFSITIWYGALLAMLSAIAWHGAAFAASRLARVFRGIDADRAQQLAEQLERFLAAAAGFGVQPHVAFYMVAAASGLLLVLWFPLWVLRIGFVKSVLRRLRLERDLLADYDVRRFLIHLLDPSYYGQTGTHDSLVGRSLRGDGASGEGRPHKRKLVELSCDGRLHVAPAVVDITKGKLEILQDTWREAGTAELRPTEVPLVDALLASVSRAPYLRAQQIETANKNSYYIDAFNIASEPLNGLMDYLRDRVSPNASSLKIYAVTAFPVSVPAPCEEPDQPLAGAMKVVDRVRDLRRYQVALLDRQLTRAYTRALKGSAAGVLTEIDTGASTPKRYLSADVVGIESPKPLRVYRTMLDAENDRDRRTAVLTAVASGCRAAMHVFERDHWPGVFQAITTDTVKCHEVYGQSPLVIQGTSGLPEICQHCEQTFHRPAAPPVVTVAPAPSKPAPAEPWSVLVLSGGVFRGVFQVGVVAGCVEAGVTPKLLVGSSVGSLMMTAAAKLWHEKDASVRNERLRTLAATFLALDQFVMTDRFADFMRRVTLRAGYTNVSIKDVDRAIRTYAELGPAGFSNTTRRVLAAFERVLYITPFELLQIVQAAREDRWSHVRHRVIDAAQNFLDRSGVRDEILGAEPLQMLIEALGKPPDEFDEPSFDCYGPHMYRLVTATNLQAGALEVFGMNAASRAKTGASFSETLLASGAFPLVFRPRLQSDLLPAAHEFAQFTDGGVMDNLPLYSVAEFIARASDTGLTVARPPGAPHLLITGSLEPEFRKKNFDSRRAEYWPDVGRRLTRIAYNTRPLGFADAQENFERIYNYQTKVKGNAAAWAPVRLRVSVVRAQWLCDTFGFHPMLGFSRVQQARSIAHGCASTLAYLAGEVAVNPGWGKAWGLKLVPETMRSDTVKWAEERERVGSSPIPPPTLRAAPTLFPSRLDEGERKGTCWFRKDELCPFSVAASSRGEDPDQVQWLNLIYKMCGKSETHSDKEQ